MYFEKMARDFVTTFRASDIGDASVCYTMEYRLIRALCAAFAAGREAMREEAARACDEASSAYYEATCKASVRSSLRGDEPRDEGYCDGLDKAAEIIRALPGKEGE